MSQLLLDRVADDVVAALETGLAPAGEHSRLYEDLGLDSLMLMQLVHLLQERRPALGELPLDDLAHHLADVGALTALLRTTTATAATAAATAGADAGAGAGAGGTLPERAA
ncbi:acyl carrier protein [Streptomyces longispororuber]|uniref:acyl carrier protein n=1 Tax=Streptomyces longispororuber TaxID=68230 RepID=UPI0036F61D80